VSKPKQDIKQIEVPIKGVVKGFQMPDESLEDAQARTVLEAEQFGNAGMVSAASPMTIRYGRSRIHLSIDEKGK
jgi:hypothetical protein